MCALGQVLNVDGLLVAVEALAMFSHQEVVLVVFARVDASGAGQNSSPHWHSLGDGNVDVTGSCVGCIDAIDDVHIVELISYTTSCVTGKSGLVCSFLQSSQAQRHMGTVKLRARVAWVVR